jgi:hypothetical protein
MTPGAFDADIARRRYLSHIQEIRDYFKDRPDDLLEICWENGDGWEKLANFLGKPVPQEPFPHRNKRRNDVQYALRRIAKRLTPKFLRKQLFHQVKK